MSIVQDSSLRLHQFDPLADIEPDDVLYQQLQADSSSTDNYSFYIKAPAPNSLLDNEVWIEYDCTTTNVGWYHQFATTGALHTTSAENAVTVNFRDGFIVNKGIGALSVTLNGQNFSNRPYIWQSVLEHLYFSREESENLLSLSGGAFDTGNGLYIGENKSRSSEISVSSGDQTAPHTATNAGVVTFKKSGAWWESGARAVTTGILVDYSASNSIWENKGWDKRISKIAIAARTAAGATGANIFANSGSYNQPTFKLFEKLPIFPFKCFDNKDLKMSIPNIRDMTINVTFLSATVFRAAVIQSGATAPDPALSLIVSSNTQIPKIHLKWYNTKIPIPKSVMLPAYIHREYEESFTFPAFAAIGSFSQSVIGQTFRTINLEAVPDLILIYFAKNPQDKIMNNPTQYHLSVDNIRIHVGGSSGRLNNISQGELYAHWLRNVRHNGTGRMNFDEWRLYHCTIALRPRDIGITWGPGFNYPVQIQIEADLTSYWNIPSVVNRAAVTTNNIQLDSQAAVPFKQYVIAIYDRMSYTIRADGSSKLEMMKLPLAPVQPQESEEMQQPTNSMQSILNV